MHNQLGAQATNSLQLNVDSDSLNQIFLAFKLGSEAFEHTSAALNGRSALQIEYRKNDRLAWVVLHVKAGSQL